MALLPIGEVRGAAVGSGIFFTSDAATAATLLLSPSTTITISNDIGDDSFRSMPGPSYVPGRHAGLNLIMDGSGNVVLSGRNTYAGTTTVSAGILTMGANDVMPANGAVVVNGTFNVNSTRQSIGNFSGFGITSLGSGALTVSPTSLSTYSGVISGVGGSLIKTGGSTLILNGNNTHTGGTVIQEGVLSVSSANLGSGDISIGSEGTLRATGGVYALLNRFSLSQGSTIDVAAEQMILSGSLSGDGGSLNKTGSGMLVIGAASTYDGGTTISEGTLAPEISHVMPAGGAVAVHGTFHVNHTTQSIGNFTGSGSTILGNGTLIVTPTSSCTYSGIITGEGGSLIKEGASTLILSGANTFTGGTTIREGTVSIHAAANMGSGPVILDGGRLAVSRTLVLPNAIALTNPSLIEIENKTVIFSVSGVLQGSEPLTKIGEGTLHLTGSNTHSGGIDIQGGTFIVGKGGALADQTVSVSSGAKLGGSGAIGNGAAIVNNGGTLAPGLSPGVLTINGNYVQSSFGIFEEEIFSAANSDRLIVSGGSVSLAGTLQPILLPDHSVYGRNSFAIIDNTGGSGITGVFETVDLAAFPTNGGFFHLIYEPNEVLVDFHVIDAQAFLPGNISAPVLSQATQNTLNFSRHLDQIRPVGFWKKASRPLAMQDCHEEEDLVAASSLYLLGGKNKQAPIRNAPVDTWEHLHPKAIHTWGLFANPIGSVGRVYSSSCNRAFNYSNAGGVVGFDYVGDWFAAGFSPGYETLNAHSIDYPQRFNMQSALATVFATFLPCKHQNFFVDIIGGGAYQWYHLKRPSPEGTVRENTQGGQWNLFSDVGYTFDARDFVFSSATAVPYITPWVGIGYTGVYVKGAQEIGPRLQAFDIGHQSIHSLRSTAALTTKYEFRWERFFFLPEIRVLWQREFLNHDAPVSIALLPEINSQLNVLGLGRDTVVIGTMLEVLYKKNLKYYGSYDYEWNERFHSHLFTLGVEGRF